MNKFFQRANKDLAAVAQDQQTQSQSSNGGGDGGTQTNTSSQATAPGGPVNHKPVLPPGATASPAQPSTEQQHTAETSGPQTTNPPGTTNTSGSENAGGQQASGETHKPTNPQDQNTNNQPPSETPEEITMRVLRERGIDVSNFDDLVAKVQNRPLTEEQKKVQAQRREQELLNLFIESGGGTMDDFYALRTIKEAQDEQVVKNDFSEKMRALDPKLSPEQIDELFRKQYYIGEEGDYEPYEVAWGRRLMADHAALLKHQKTEPLSKLEQQLQLREEAMQSKRQWDSTVNDFVKTMPKVLELPIGISGNNKDLGTFKYNLSDEEQRELVDSLKEPATLLNMIVDRKTGKTDLKSLYEVLLWKKFGASAIKAAAGEYHSRGIDEITATLDNRPNLTQVADTTVPTDAQQVEEGKQVIANDAKSLLGRKTFRKTIG